MKKNRVKIENTKSTTSDFHEKLMQAFDEFEEEIQYIFDKKK